MWSSESLVLVDTHVHIHDCFSPAELFDSAFKNFEAVAAREQSGQEFLGVLMLTEMFGVNWFERLVAFSANREVPEADILGEWKIEATDEPNSLIVKSGDDRRIIVIAGRQIVTSENLEVLALATEQRFEDGLSVEAVLSRVNSSGAIAVMPWGFGKWWGRRGSLMNRLMEEHAKYDFFLGDNSGRPRFTPKPVQFRRAAVMGLRIFPGSDALPFASEFWRPGSMGIMLRAPLSEDTPAADLKEVFKEVLRSLSIQVKPYGQLENPLRFVRNQCAMQLLKLRHRVH